MSKNEIFSSRVLKFPIEQVYQAFSNPNYLKIWWGPHGFTNTFHEFDLQPGGKWNLTMHGPEKGNYENASIFDAVEPEISVRWTRLSQPIFIMEVGFEKIENNKSTISFKMIFETVEECEKIRKFAQPKNEENFDRLEKVLENMVS